MTEISEIERVKKNGSPVHHPGICLVEKFAKRKFLQKKKTKRKVCIVF